MTKSTILYIFLIFILIFIIFLFISNYIHPILMIILLITYTLTICLIMSMWSFNYMYSIITFLIIIRGILIIFLYFASLISNEQFKFNVNIYLLINFITNISTIIYLILNWTFLAPPYLNALSYNIINNERLTVNNINYPPFNNIIIIYLHPYNNFTILCIIFLLFTLFTIIKICSSKSLTLRKIK